MSLSTRFQLVIMAAHEDPAKLAADSSQYAICLEDIQAAHERIQYAVHRTPLLSCQSICEATGLEELFMKAEALQKSGSFKVRCYQVIQSFMLHIKFRAGTRGDQRCALFEPRASEQRRGDAFKCEPRSGCCSGCSSAWHSRTHRHAVQCASCEESCCAWLRSKRVGMRAYQ